MSKNDSGPAVSSTRLLDLLRVRWSNWKNRSVARAYRTMADAMKRDPSCAESWRANIACVIHDGAEGMVPMPKANIIADRMMVHLWGCDRYRSKSNDSGLRSPDRPRAGDKQDRVVGSLNQEAKG